MFIRKDISIMVFDVFQLNDQTKEFFMTASKRNFKRLSSITLTIGDARRVDMSIM